MHWLVFTMAKRWRLIDLEPHNSKLIQPVLKVQFADALKVSGVVGQEG